ncbi:MAG: prepilin-type N-terminal cleavage/methylation domain-containing protein [Bacilli bacterium]|nr:prepilin-type N-terminal cleavage/methylation domain-containing protein [Bacilli bacterium]
MKKIFKRKKLNNKGFTLIELLAVVVILAVVMGIAANSVLSSMNKARGGSITDSALVVANGYNQKYLEAQVDGSTTIGVMNFNDSKVYELPQATATEYNLKANDYNFSTQTAENRLLITLTANKDNQSTSFVYFDQNTGKFTVCLAAKSGGSVYVKDFAKNQADLVKTSAGYIIKNTAGQMFACSNGKKTW